MHEVVRIETKKSVCHVCNVQIGKGNPFEWTVEGKAYMQRHPYCVPKQGELPLKDEAPSAETAAKLSELGLKVKVLNDGQAVLEKAVLDLSKRRENVVQVRFSNGDAPTTAEIRGTHSRFMEALSITRGSMPLYLFGPQASGKSKIAEQIAEAYGCPLHAIELKANTPNSAIMGFVDANGKYHSTPVRRAAEAKGPRLLLIEEMDNASDMHLVGLHPILDAALDGSRREIQFPDGPVAIESGLIVVATGNTAGFGGTLHHTGRRPFDSATASRFAYLEIGYDEQLEDRLAATILESQKAREQWVVYLRELRKAAAADAPQLVICMRAIIKGLRILSAGDDKELTRNTAFKVADVAVFRGIESELAGRLHRAAWARMRDKLKAPKQPSKGKKKRNPQGHKRSKADRGGRSKARSPFLDDLPEGF